MSSTSPGSIFSRRSNGIFIGTGRRYSSRLLFWLILFLPCTTLYAQNNTDSLRTLIREHRKRDTTWVWMQCQLMEIYYSRGEHRKNDSLGRICLRISDSLRYDHGKFLSLQALARAWYYLGSSDAKTQVYVDSAIALAEANHWQAHWANMMVYKANMYMRMGDMKKCLDYGRKGYEAAVRTNDPTSLTWSNVFMGNVYYNYFSDYNTALEYYFESLKYSKGTMRYSTLTNIGRVFEQLKEYDKANQYYTLALQESLKHGDKWPELLALKDKGHLYATLGKYDSAKLLYTQSLEASRSLGIRFPEAQSLHGLANVYAAEQQYDRAMKNLQEAEKIILEIGSTRELIGYYSDMARIKHHQRDWKGERHYLLKALSVEPERDKLTYKNVLTALVALEEREGNLQQALKYQRQINTLQDSTFSEQKVREAMRLEANFQLELSKKAVETLVVENRLKEGLIEEQRWNRNVMIVVLVLLIATVLLICYAYYTKIQSNEKLRKKNEIIETQRENLAHSLTDLQKIKDQLVVSEKMASLGQMTAGIAHEINNPLNFISGGVQTLASINANLVEAAKTQQPLSANDIEDLEKDSRNLKASVQSGIERISKIIQSLNAFSGPQELERVKISVNKLLEISYTLLKAKLTSNKIEFVRKYNADQQLDVVVNPPQITQVLVNIIDNAIYVLAEKPGERRIIVDVIPSPSAVEIRITDNGPGIPEQVQKNIMEPFFTTKPVGKGTGLGLYVSYRIMERHQGAFTFETKPQEGTTFIVKLNREQITKGKSQITKDK